jgi:HlyD family secretion protein
MKKKPWGKRAMILLAAGVIAIIVIGLLPKRVIVETTKVARGDLEVTLEAEGRTRVRDRFLVAASVGGRLDRITLREGDHVDKGMPIGAIRPQMLDPLHREEQEHRIAAAEAGLRQAITLADASRARLEQSEREHERLLQLQTVGVVSRQDLERASTSVTLARTELRNALLQIEAAEKGVAIARVPRRAYPGNEESRSKLLLRAPASGRILQVLDRGERLVAAGTPILQIGDPDGLEFVVDLLTSDAVRVEPGTAIRIEGWGGAEPLQGRVRYIEPSAFTKVSALGVEEQRVNVVAEFLDRNRKIGDGYRANAVIILSEGRNLLTIPTGALFRKDGRWCVFAVRDGHATTAAVTLGRMNAFSAEVLDGLVEGDEVVVHPSDKVDDGIEVEVIVTAAERGES